MYGLTFRLRDKPYNCVYGQLLSRRKRRYNSRRKIKYYVKPDSYHFSSNAVCSCSDSSCSGEFLTIITASIPQLMHTRQLCTLPRRIVAYIRRQYTHATLSFATNDFTLSVQYFIYSSLDTDILILDVET